jgi:hypothetical protein
MEGKNEEGVEPSDARANNEAFLEETFELPVNRSVSLP